MTNRWHSLSPTASFDGALRSLERHLEAPHVQAQIDAEENAERYPAQTMAALRSAGLTEVLTTTFTPLHIYGLNALLARHSGSVGITVGVNMLGLLPIALGASNAQRAELLGRVREGAAVALLLTEWDRGSDLRATQTWAERGVLEGERFTVSSENATHYRVTGEKHLINAAAQSELLVTLARTREAEQQARGALAGGDLSVLVLSPGEGVQQLPRHRTLPMHGAEIGGVRFDGALCPLTRRIGEEGEGFSLIQRALTISRGAISALAWGTTRRALELTRRFAHERVLYGAPIVKLDPIAEHLLRLDAYDLAIAALSVKAACLVNAIGLAAAHHTAIAKYACCELAERAVEEGRNVLSARALVEGDYARVLRDVQLYAVFDGTRHVMLAQVRARLRQLATRAERPDSDALERLRGAYAQAPVPVAELGRMRASAYVPDPVSHARLLARLPGDVDVAPLETLAIAVLATCRQLVAREAWEADAQLGFSAARALCLLEMAFAIAEFADPTRRRALGLRAYDEPNAAARARYALALVAGQAASELQALTAEQGLDAFDELSRAIRALWSAAGGARPLLRNATRERPPNEALP